ncbi:hypothetical protein GX586_06350 [bacterium]|nr:hypothetical protein [bacterium]
MKTPILAALAAAIVITAALPAAAATPQWSSTNSGTVYQMVPDGAGGCALFIIRTNGTFSVVWLGNKGAARYTKDNVNPISAMAIVECTSKALSYLSTTGMTTVDKKGVETFFVPPPGGIFYPALLPSQAIAQDRKGFFVNEYRTNILNQMSIIWRYLHK